MPTIDLNALVDRVVAIERELYPTIPAVAFGLYAGESMPYFANMIGEITLSEEQPDDMSLYTVIVNIVHVGGHVTEGYDGQIERDMRSRVTTLIDGINSRAWAQSLTYTSGLTHLDRIFVSRCNPFEISESSGGPGAQLICTIEITALFTLPLDQEYG